MIIPNLTKDRIGKWWSQLMFVKGESQNTLSMERQRVKEKILLIDGEPNILRLLYAILYADYDLIMKSTPIDAIKWLENGNDVSLIISELELSNFNTAALIRSIRISGFHHTVPIIILSDGAMAKEEGDIPAGVSAIINKPFDPVSLKLTIANILDGNKPTTV